MAAAQTQPIGKALIIYGTVKAVAANGTERLLAPNSPIYAGERIVTGPDGSISIVFNDNSGHVDLGRMSDVLMDQDVYAGAGPDQAADAVAQAAEIQAALENGEIDPTTQLPPPAAGAGVAHAAKTGASAVGQRVAAGVQAMKDRAAEFVSEAVSPPGETASVRGAEDAALPAPVSEPGWARRMRRRQQATQAATTAVHAIRAGDHAGGGVAPSLRDESNP